MTKPKARVPPVDNNKPKKPRTKKITGPNLAESEKTFVGQEVHGIVDGSFDAGYLLTVKVGDSPLVFRGLVFAPGLSIPLSKGNDIAPTIKSTARDQQVVLPVSVQFSTEGEESSLAATPQGPAGTKQAQGNEGISGSMRISPVEQGCIEPVHASLGLIAERELTGHEDFVENKADQ